MVVLKRAGASLLALAFSAAASPASADPTASAPLVVQPSSSALSGAFPPPLVYRMRSRGLLATGIIAASIGATVFPIGAILYAQASDPCLQGTRFGTGACAAQRGDFDAGMAVMGVGGALFALGVPIAVLGGSASEAKPAPVVRLGASPGGARLTLVF